MDRIYPVKTTSQKINPKVKDILTLLGIGTFLTASLIMPGLPVLLKPALEEKRKKEFNEWKKFNTWRLKFLLKRLYKQKLVELIETNNGFAVQITDKGRKKLLKYDLDNLELDSRNWDGKWRIIMYDIHENHKQARVIFQKLLIKLKFLQLQKSVYLTPFKCENEIEYLRQIYNIGKDVLVIKVSGLENEKAYKEYFGLF